jgi:hypothetical protein
MECTNGQPAGYRSHREQSNPNAASRDQNGANKNPLHRRGFYRPPGFSCKSPHDREPTSGLEPLTPAPATSKAVPYSEPAKNGRQVLMNLLCPLRIRQYR